MTPHAKTAVAHFHTANGVSQDKSEDIRVVERRSLLSFDENRDRLHILLEPIGAFADPLAICQQIADCLEEVYLQQKGSVTARLRSAVQTANKLLFSENLQLPPEQRGIVGVTCAAMRGSEVYLALAGPALAYLAHQGELQRFPADSPWLKPELPTALDARQATALGWRKELEPDLFYCQVQAEDLLVLCTTSLVRLASEIEIVEALAFQDAETARDNLQRLAEQQEMAAIIVEVLAATALPKKVPAVAPRQTDTYVERPRPAHAAQQESFVNEEQETEEPSRTLYRPASTPRPATPARSESGAGLGSRLSSLAQSLMPDRENAPRARGASEGISFTAIARLGLIALVIPVILFVLFQLNKARVQNARDTEFANKLAAATELVAAAQGGTPTEQRATLLEADTRIAELLVLRPESEEVKTLQSTFEAQRDQVDKVSRVHFLGELASFPSSDQPSLPGRLAVSRTDVYILDGALGRISRYALDDRGEAFRSPVPETLLDATTNPVGNGPQKPLDVVCTRMGVNPDDGKLLILTQGPQLLERAGQPPRLAAKTLENAQALLGPKAIESYYDAPNLYVYILDPTANIIKKYQVAGNSYSDGPEDYTAAEVKINLQEGVDLAIDGSIYILLKNGKIAKLFQGKEVAFSMEGLDKPLSNPVAISISSPDNMEKGSVYVADAGNRRIVEFDKKGRFVRQFQPASDKPPFDDLRDIFVQESARRILILNGATLRYMNLPD